ncbi:hypothetical protein [Amycolatopsis sp. NPDC059021]|uniref:hypothetical protein n=1 Tax=Amycolatopsis sp. NPDC059021 TaxID=3346704 RepID=UPI00367332D6
MTHPADPSRDPATGAVPPAGAGEPTVEQPAAAAEGTPPVPPAASQPTVEQPAANQTAEHAEQAPPGATPPPPAGGTPPPPPGTWGAPAAAAQPRQPGGFRRFVAHRATQLVAVGVLGLVVGGGVVGIVAAATHHDGKRPGIARMHHQRDGGGPRGHGNFGPGQNGRGGAEAPGYGG